jgi:hypothetical protein
MKIAFVGQPIDTILPPYQSSVGACTFGAACSLSKSCEVVVYGTRNRHKNFPANFLEQNVHYRFFPYRSLTGSPLGRENTIANFFRWAYLLRAQSGFIELSAAGWRRIYACRLAM